MIAVQNKCIIRAFGIQKDAFGIFIKIDKQISSQGIYSQFQNEALKIVYTPYENEHLGIWDIPPLPAANHLTPFEGVVS